MANRRIPEGVITKGLRAPVRALRFHNIALSLKGRKPLADEHMDVRSGSPKPITFYYENADGVADENEQASRRSHMSRNNHTSPSNHSKRISEWYKAELAVSEAISRNCTAGEYSALTRDRRRKFCWAYIPMRLLLCRLALETWHHRARRESHRALARGWLRPWKLP